MKEPKVSVILPVFNAQLYLDEAIQSILNQTYADFEFIIIDDGSTDKSADIIREYRDGRIKIIVLGRNKGLVEALNTGLCNAKGEFIAVMNADDVSLPQRLEAQTTLMETDPTIVMCGSRVAEMETGKYYDYDLEDQHLRADLLYFNPFCHPSVMMRKNALRDNFLEYRNDFPHAEDFDMWVRLKKIGKIRNTPETLLRYRIHKDQVIYKNRDAMIDSAYRLSLQQIEELCGELSESEKQAVTNLVKSVFGREMSKNEVVDLVALYKKLINLNAERKLYNNEGLALILERSIRSYPHFSSKK